jgi:hypothetical protein
VENITFFFSRHHHTIVFILFFKSLSIDGKSEVERGYLLAQDYSASKSCIQDSNPGSLSPETLLLATDVKKMIS